MYEQIINAKHFDIYVALTIISDTIQGQSVMLAYVGYGKNGGLNGDGDSACLM